MSGVCVKLNIIKILFLIFINTREVICFSMVLDYHNKPRHQDMHLPGQRIVLGPASPVKRVLAFIADVLIINFIILAPFDKIFSRLVPQTSLFSFNVSFITPRLMFVMYIVGLLFLLYFSWFEHKLAQSPGKMLFGLFVISSLVDKTKIPRLSFWQAVVRNSQVFFVFTPLVFLMILDFVFVLFNKNSQRLLEIASKSIVIERYVM